MLTTIQTKIMAISLTKGVPKVLEGLSTSSDHKSLKTVKMLDDGVFCLLDECDYTKTYAGIFKYKDFINYIDSSNIMGQELVSWYKELPMEVNYIYLYEIHEDGLPF